MNNCYLFEQKKKRGNKKIVQEKKNVCVFCNETPNNYVSK